MAESVPALPRTVKKNIATLASYFKAHTTLFIFLFQNVIFSFLSVFLMICLFFPSVLVCFFFLLSSQNGVLSLSLSPPTPLKIQDIIYILHFTIGFVVGSCGQAKCDESMFRSVCQAKFDPKANPV